LDTNSVNTLALYLFEITLNMLQIRDLRPATAELIPTFPVTTQPGLERGSTGHFYKQFLYHQLPIHQIRKFRKPCHRWITIVRNTFVVHNTQHKYSERNLNSSGLHYIL